LLTAKFDDFWRKFEVADRNIAVRDRKIAIADRKILLDNRTAVFTQCSEEVNLRCLPVRERNFVVEECIA
jgi:hypothetical protein